MRQERLYWLREDDPLNFPPVETALSHPNGLVAVGGDLSSERLLNAYRKGIFPWYEDGQPILWWSPDPRALLYPQRLRVTRSLAKRVRNAGFTVTLDTAFESTIAACAAPREGSSGTWITEGMLAAYGKLHSQGYAHSVEVWDEDEQIGGLYGLSLGSAFFGESMFSRRADASKIALVWLARQLRAWSFHFIDCQVSSRHLEKLGAIDVPRARFIQELKQALGKRRSRASAWCFDHGFHPLSTEALA